MKRVVILCLLLSGCAWLPWHPFGTPLTAEKKAETKVVAAKSDVLDEVQASVHKADNSVDLALAGNQRALPLAKNFLDDARTLIDQERGAPSARDVTTWRELVAKLASDNAKIREQAQRDNATNEERIAKLSTRLDNATAAQERAESKALAYAGEIDRLWGYIIKGAWIVGALALFYFSGQILAFLAHFNPAFAAPAAFVNSIASPAMHSLLHKAEAKLAAKIA